MTTRPLIIVLVGVLTSFGCASRVWYRRAPEAERSVFLARGLLHEGMALHEVVQTMVEVRGTSQDASLEFRCPDSRVTITLHAGEQLAHAGSTRVYAAGFASIWIHDFKKQNLAMWGFQRQGDFTRAVLSREADLLACGSGSLSFNAIPEGSCGYDTVDVSFNSDARVSTIGPVRYASCNQNGAAER
jgi:hypothetical protein